MSRPRFSRIIRTLFATTIVVSLAFSNVFANGETPEVVSVSSTDEGVYVYMDGNLFEIFGNYNCYWNEPTINIGASYSQGIFYSGKMDNIRTYNRALTAQEVQTLYNAKQ